jgi:hypothetical protein
MRHKIRANKPTHIGRRGDGGPGEGRNSFNVHKQYSCFCEEFPILRKQTNATGLFLRLGTSGRGIRGDGHLVRAKKPVPEISGGTAIASSYFLTAISRG